MRGTCHWVGNPSLPHQNCFLCLRFFCLSEFPTSGLLHPHHIPAARLSTDIHRSLVAFSKSKGKFKWERCGGCKIVVAYYSVSLCMWCLKEGKEERWIVAVSMKERPKVRWLFVINKKEWRKEGKREPQEKADGKNAGSHPQSLHTHTWYKIPPVFNWKGIWTVDLHGTHARGCSMLIGRFSLHEQSKQSLTSNLSFRGNPQ